MFQRFDFHFALLQRNQHKCISALPINPKELKSGYFSVRIVNKNITLVNKKATIFFVFYVFIPIFLKSASVAVRCRPFLSVIVRFYKI